MLKFFRNHVVEVQSVPRSGLVKDSETSNVSQLSIYDFKNRITLFWSKESSGEILPNCLEIEQDAIYYLTESRSNDRVERNLVKLSEMEANIKIHKLMCTNQYQEAHQIATDAGFPREIQCEIIKEYADKLFSQQKYDEAINQYIKTIGFLNPSFVI